MALVLADRVQETGTANTTVSFNLSATVSGFQSFAVVGNGNTTYYSAFDATGNWEVGIGTYSTTGPILTRTTILSSSNAGSAVTFVGTVNVFVTYPSENAALNSSSITVAMSGAAATTNPDFVAAWSDDTGTSFTEGATDGVLNGASQVTLVAAPAASTRRIIKTVYIENKDTAAVTITVTYNNNGTLRTIAKVTLQVADTWSTDGTTDSSGALKQTMGTVSLTTGVTGVLPNTNGGTGQSSAFTQYGITYASTTSVLATSAAGTTGQYLQANTSAAPTWVTPTAGVTTGKAIAMAMIFGF